MFHWRCACGAAAAAAAAEGRRAWGKWEGECAITRRDGAVDSVLDFLQEFFLFFLRKNAARDDRNSFCFPPREDLFASIAADRVFAGVDAEAAEKRFIVSQMFKTGRWNSAIGAFRLRSERIRMGREKWITALCIPQSSRVVESTFLGHNFRHLAAHVSFVHVEMCAQNIVDVVVDVEAGLAKRHDGSQVQ